MSSFGLKWVHLGSSGLNLGSFGLKLPGPRLVFFFRPPAKNIDVFLQGGFLGLRSSGHTAKLGNFRLNWTPFVFIWVQMGSRCFGPAMSMWLSCSARWPKMGQDRPKHAPKMAIDGTLIPKMNPIWTPSWLQAGGPKMRQDGPRRTQDAPR